MNRPIRSVTGTLVQSVPDDKLDELAKLLGLDADETAKLKKGGHVVVVVNRGAHSGG